MNCITPITLGQNLPPVRKRVRRPPSLGELCDEIVLLSRQRDMKLRSCLSLRNQVRAFIATQAGYDHKQVSKEDDPKLAAEMKRKSKDVDALLRHVYEGRALAASYAEKYRSILPIIRPFALGQRQTVDMILDPQRRDYEAQMVKVAKRLPVYPAFVESTYGFAALGLSNVVGAAGDLSAYKTHSHFWKRMGLAVIDGKRQGRPGENATDEDWIIHGYKGQRRATAWNIEVSILRHSGDAKIHKSPYGQIYRARKAYEIERFREAGLFVLKKDDPRPEGVDDSMVVSAKWVSNRAQRYMGKKLMKHLYYAWETAGTQVLPA